VVAALGERLGVKFPGPTRPKEPCQHPFLAAPESFLPSALTAFGKHVSRLHFLMKLLSAAPYVCLQGHSIRILWLPRF
jgi:hypothetical protein